MAEAEDPLRKLKRRHKRDLRYARAEGMLSGVVSMLRPGDVAVDCGANRGDVTAQLALRPVELLKVAHHGSDDPGLPALLERLRPRVAVIEVGQENPYGHPAATTLAALRVVPRVYRTDRNGEVTVADGPRGLVVDHQ